MLKKLKQGMFPFLIGFSALSVSASAAFYSVSGLSKLFAGAEFAVILMAGSLEFAKLVTASLIISILGYNQQNITNLFIYSYYYISINY
jgi:hypothetical protein